MRHPDLYCGADHRGRPTASVITCRTCGRQYDTACREDWLLAHAEDRLATAKTSATGRCAASAT